MQFAAFVTYMFLDNPMSIAAGREIYGYPKNWGWPTFPDDPPEAMRGPFTTDRPADVPHGSLALDAFAIPAYAPASTPGRHRLLTLKPDGPAPGGTTPSLESPLAAAAWSRELILGRAGRRAGTRAFVVDALDRWLPHFTVNQLFLRQLRAAAGGLGADHQDIITAPATLPRWPRLALLPEHELTINELASHPIRSELGIDDGPTIAGVRATFDFTVGPGTTLWRARS